jgi:hypothetical protein
MGLEGRGVSAIFQPKVEHWDGSRELWSKSIVSAHTATSPVLHDKSLHGHP